MASSNRINLSNPKITMKLPNLIEAQIESYTRFIEEDLVNYIQTISPITDNTGKLWMLEFLKHEIKPATRTEEDCLRKGVTFSAPLYWNVRLVNKQTGEMKEQKVFMCDIPVMTPRGSYIINGVEKCIVHQIIRAEGVIFLPNGLKYGSYNLYQAKLIPQKGPWITLDISKSGVLNIKLGPRRSKINLFTFLRAMGYNSDAELRNLFKDIQLEQDHPDFVGITLSKDTSQSTQTAIIDVYKRLRPDLQASVESAKEYIESLVLDPRRLLLGEIGRYQVNKKIDPKYSKEMKPENYALNVTDIIGIAERLIKTNLRIIAPDDIDHLGNRRLRSVNELLGEVIINAIKRIEKNTKDKMSLHSTDELLTANDVLSSRPLTSAFNDFFGTSQISRFMGAKNIITELSNLRHITAAGPKGLSKERATFSVRDVHYSHYGRLCAIHTPDGTNIGVVNYLAAFAKINRYGFIEVPYRRLIKTVNVDNSLNRIVYKDIKSDKDEVIVKAGTKIDKKVIEVLSKAGIKEIDVNPFVSDEVVYMDGDSELLYRFTTTQLDFDDDLNIIQKTIPIRHKDQYYIGESNEADFIDVDSSTIASINFLSIPFAQNTDPARTIIATSNINQALPLIKKEAPILGSGREEELAYQSNRNIYAPEKAKVKYVDANQIILETSSNKEIRYNLTTFSRSNDNTLLHQQPVVSIGQEVEADELLAEGSCSVNGEMSIGTNVLTAAMFYDGLTYEDGWVVSEKLLKEGKFDALLIKSHSKDIMDTKLGPEEMTADIPNIPEALLANLEENGLVRIGAYVKANDILAGIIAPKGEVDVSPEEKLLRAIFGESASDKRDVSLRVPNGESGIVIDTQVLTRDDEELPPGVLMQVRVWVAKVQSINIGDKYCNMYSQKGVVAKIVPEEDMPYLPDGTPLDMLFSPVFIKRMNVSLLKEMHVGMKARVAGVKVSAPIFTYTDENILDKILEEKKLKVNPKSIVYDGRNGVPFRREVAYGNEYMLKLTHIADQKVHARSTGPYTIVTQQPLGGKAKFGGQRVGEMEVWALEAHGVANILHEVLTIKSDDVSGRSAAYEAIIHGEKVKLEGTPESFKVLINEFRALGLNIVIYNKEGQVININTKK